MHQNAKSSLENAPLHFAVGRVDHNVAKMLLDNGANVDQVDGTGNTPLILACKYAKYEACKLLLENGANPIAKNNKGKTPSSIAEKRKDRPLQQLLVQRIAAIPAEQVSQAAKKRGLERVEEILDNSIQLNGQVNVDTFESSLKTTSEIERCIERDDDVALRKIIDGSLRHQVCFTSALIFKACRNSPKAIAVYLSYGIGVNSRGQTGLTLLMVASFYGCIGVMKELLKRGASVNTRSVNSGRTALHIACQRQNKEAIVELLSNGADHELKDLCGSTALGYLAPPMALEVLLLHKDSLPQNALKRAIEKDDLEQAKRMFTLLVHSGYETTYLWNETKFGYSPIHLAANGSPQCLQYFLGIGAPLNDLSAKGLTPLMVAAQSGCLSTTSLLLDLCVHLDMHSSREGYTALHFACIGGHMSIVKALIDEGANEEAQDLKHRKTFSYLEHDAQMDLFSQYMKNHPKNRLEKAIREDDPSKMNEIMDYIAMSNSFTKKFESPVLGFDPLQLAVTCAPKCFKQLLLRLRLRIDDLLPNGQNLLMMASAAGCKATVEMILSYGAKINTIDEKTGQNALHVACIGQHEEVVNLLVKEGADDTLLDGKGKVAFFYLSEKVNAAVQVYHHQYSPKRRLEQAIVRDDLDEAKVLLKIVDERISHIFHPHTYLGFSPLILSTRGSPKCFEFLLSERLDVLNRTTLNGQTLLMIASDIGCLETVQVLLRYNVILNITTRAEKYTALHFACMGKHAKVVEALVYKGADETMLDWTNRIAFSYLPIETRETIVLYWKQNNPKKRLHDAILRDDLDEVHKIVMKVWYDRGMRYPDDFLGFSPLFLSAAGSPRCLKDFLDTCFAHLECKNSYGNTSLMIASDAGCVETVKILLQHRANANAFHNDTKCTALHLACKGGHRNVIFALLTEGVDETLLDSEKRTAFSYLTDDLQKEVKLYHETKHPKNRLKTAILRDDAEEARKICNQLITSHPDTHPRLYIQKNFGFSPIHASAAGAPKCLSYFVTEMTVDELDNDGFTALMIACDSGCIESVKLLLVFEASINWTEQRPGNGVHSISHVVCTNTTI